MPNTLSNVNGDVRRIHADIPLSTTVDGLTLFLSSHEHTLAQVELTEIHVSRRFGRRVLSIDVIDRSGFAELQGRENAIERVRIPLGGRAVIGRGRFDLPLMQAEIISESHVTLSYLRAADGDVLSIHDNVSANGSHIAEPGETSWRDRINELSSEDSTLCRQPAGHHELYGYNPGDYDYLFDGDRRYGLSGLESTPPQPS